MKIPVEKQLEMVKKAMPNSRRLGILYCCCQPQAVVTAEEASQAGRKLGIVIDPYFLSLAHRVIE